MQKIAGDGSSTENTFNIPGRQAKFLTIADLLVTAPGQSSRSPANSLLVAVQPATLAQGTTAAQASVQHWYSVATGWSGYKTFEVKLSADKNQITLATTDTQNRQFSGSLDARNTKLVKWLGNEGAAYLLRLDAGPTDFNLQQVVTGTSSASGEGEPAAAATAFSVSEVPPQAAASWLAMPVDAVSPSEAGDAAGDVASSLIQTGEGEDLTILAPAFLAAETANLRATTSAVTAATVADVGWFAPLFDDDYAAGTATDAVTVTGDDAQAFVEKSRAVDALLSQEDLAAGLDSAPVIEVTPSGNADEYSTAVDALLAEDVDALAEAI